MSRNVTCCVLAALLASITACVDATPQLTAEAQRGKGKDGSGDRDRGVAATPAHAAAEILVEVLDPTDATTVAALAEAVGADEAERVGATSFFLLRLPATADLDDVTDVLEGNLAVLRAELNFVGEAPEGDPSDATVLPGDLFASAIPVQSAFAALELPDAHAFSRGAGVVVAVIDTGIDFSHPYFADRIAPGGADFVDGDLDPTDERAPGRDADLDGFSDEQFGHGTFVASLVLAIAPDARILPIRALDSEGLSTTARVAAAITWAVDHGATVINTSIGVPGDAKVVHAAVEYAEINDVLVIASAGNESVTAIAFPASYGDVIGVAASDGNGVVADFSSVGRRLSLVAPGVNLLGAYPMSANPFGTAVWSGTSFSSPVVAGAAALVRARFPALDAQSVEARLDATALDVTAINAAANADLIGDGLVQPAAAVR